MTHVAIAGPASGGFRVGRVLGTAWKVFRSQFWRLMALALWPFVAGEIFKMATPDVYFYLGEVPPGTSNATVAVLIVTEIALSLTGVLVAGSLSYAAFQGARGRPVRVGAAIRQGFRRFFPLLGVMILAGLGVTLGMLLLIIPGIILAIRWSTAMQACVIEGRGPLASLRRSRELTKGHSWKTFGTLLVVTVPFLIFIVLFDRIAVSLLGRPYEEALASLKAMGTVAQFLMILWSTYLYCGLVTMYRELRVAHEGVDVDDLKTVFD